MRALTARLSDGNDLGTALRLVAAPAVFTAAAIRARMGETPLRPDPERGHACDILRMTRGNLASAAEVKALDAYLVTVADHGLKRINFRRAGNRLDAGGAYIGGAEWHQCA